jgi:hypothetical protein
MTPNPYEPPRAAGPTAAVATASRGPFVLAAVGAFLAGGYWALITLLLVAGVAAGSVSGAQIILPVILIALYIARGTQLLRGDPMAARRILWLHGVGGIAAIVQMQSSTGLVVTLQGIKVVIHVFGGITAFLAQRSVSRPPV